MSKWLAPPMCARPMQCCSSRLTRGGGGRRTAEILLQTEDGRRTEVVAVDEDGKLDVRFSLSVFSASGS